MMFLNQRPGWCALIVILFLHLDGVQQCRTKTAPGATKCDTLTPIGVVPALRVGVLLGPRASVGRASRSRGDLLKFIGLLTGSGLIGIACFVHE